jgi:Fe-S oxidoreductase
MPASWKQANKGIWYRSSQHGRVWRSGVQEQRPVKDSLTEDDALVVALTGGAASVCYQCGACTAICPWAKVRQEPLAVRALIRRAQLGLPEWKDGLWLCTTCAQCEVYCPRGVSITDVMRGLRYLDWKRRQTPKGLPSLLWSIHWNNNPWGQPPSMRSQWAKEGRQSPRTTAAPSGHLPDYDPDLHEILLYVGCTASYDQRAQKVARALIHLFNAAGVSYGYLGDDEPCCGEAALSVGHIPYFLELASQATQIFAEKRIDRLVTLSPHCYDVFANHYPASRQDGAFKASHYAMYLDGLLEQGRLQLEKPVTRKVTYHDPCYLARHNQQADAPRRVLQAIPGVELVEMAHSGADALCCGGGGGRMWLETAPGERFADIRVQEAMATGAEVLVTACPFCIVCLEDSLKASAIPGMVVMDVAEIAALALATPPVGGDPSVMATSRPANA